MEIFKELPWPPAIDKIIEFYNPSNFRKRGTWVPPKERGKIIEFVPEMKKTP